MLEMCHLWNIVQHVDVGSACVDSDVLVYNLLVYDARV